jgi:hypothetical protein
MISYKDRAWCPMSINERCSCRKGCYRAFTEEDQANAEKWWGSKDFPISQFQKEPSCFVPIHTTDGEE